MIVYKPTHPSCYVSVDRNIFHVSEWARFSSGQA
jgi:hypothetical protein